MSEPIQAGDLVVVVGRCKCGCAPGLGRVFRVTGFEESEADCSACNKYLGKIRGAYASDGNWYGVNRLKRIPPFPELKDERHDEEITA